MDYSELNLNSNQLDELSKIGLNMIKDDKKHLIDYAINKIMSNVVYESGPDSTPDNNVDILKQKIKLFVER